MGDRDRLIGAGDRELLGECCVDVFRASGPGGQKRNKTSNAFRLRHEASGVTATATESRSQHDNRTRALQRLRRAAALELREPVDPDTFEPPAELRALLRAGRPTHRQKGDPDYLAAIAALLDLFVARDCAVSETARDLGVGSAALSKVVLADDQLARKVNELRAERGLRALK